ncbi:type VI secretion system baseplate subunit TssG [Massilia sp. Se16.2.3]|uniref:type VI secretion system baseplate subunit TssG n=1 Tax=Massilia sp. Se16.2.3 TaxID=2709303 RepID=UPI001600D995|nr:type VI secretion system baseplate subunit TssG [Massilia sp. Se16.2.3]QNA99686.1 type VI secretion system baseplate subunit TssG [Massilia sp. Se16.2.3]
MRPAHRRNAAAVIERLLAAPHEFEFVQAVRVLLAWLARQGVAPEAALREHLRFENSLRPGFPPAQIEAPVCESGTSLVGVDDAGEPAPPRLRMTPAFMGLLGTQGSLPAHVTERIAAWQAGHDDEAPRAFLDMLSGRMLALFYEAWFKHRIELAPAGGAERLRPLLLALAGFPDDSRALAGSVPAPEAGENRRARGTRRPGGALRRPAAGTPVSGVVLERVLASYFGVAIALEEAVGHWSRLLPAEQSALGTHALLGQDTALGERSWRPDLRARLRIGPLRRAAFERFLPSGESAATLRAILRVLAPPCVEFEVQLVLCRSSVGPSFLGAGGDAPRLGRDSFLLTGAVACDRADMRYVIAPMAALAPLSGRQQGSRAAR